MGSSQPPDGNMPFGYHISDHIPDHVPDQDFMFLRPPTPPPGDPLLSHDDSRLLNLFFEDMTSNQYPSYGEGLNYSDQWISQLPPAFLGHTTSYGQQPQQPSASPINGIPTTAFQDVFTFGQSMMPPPPQPPLQLQHPQQHPHHGTPTPHTPIEQNSHVDVAAVLTSLQHGHQNGHAPGANGANHTPMVPSQHPAAPADRMRPPPRNHISPDRNSPVRHRHVPSNESDTLFADMMFGNPQGLTSQRPIETPELQWGSDSSFARAQGYIPPDHESSELLEQKRLGVLKVFSISDSTTTTRPSSPSQNGESSSHFRRDSNMNGHVKEECDAEAPPAKRRKSKSKAKEEVQEDVEDLTYIPPKAVARKRKSKADLKAAAETPVAAQEAPGKRRKSTLNSAKTPRENLTDAQKRENHIKSEQKRRGAIKEGFDDLGEIVPNLRGGGYSKSAMLSLAGEWLDALLKGNAELEKL
ncbi:uncharacterized protein F4822DRAFT_428952 [Hypoxylon trugodes]|uniref:uncharacterized protein n=1 Tax=Hypoxylon trugodes TaxID=326681 RepID=UPI0021991567|nr:uncharacterized protein F4822DRAFT_428952 [Hypoxylon trugodes]KAI1388332.1 hypothetical protein F4822DRAFT_428952 [Hypoxylon trugodes]